jgi:hypothetical protein
VCARVRVCVCVLGMSWVGLDLGQPRERVTQIVSLRTRRHRENPADYPSPEGLKLISPRQILQDLLERSGVIPTRSTTAATRYHPTRTRTRTTLRRCHATTTTTTTTTTIRLRSDVVQHGLLAFVLLGSTLLLACAGAGAGFAGGLRCGGGGCRRRWM